MILFFNIIKGQYEGVQSGSPSVNLHKQGAFMQQTAPSKHDGISIPIPVPIPLPVRPGQILIPNGPQKGPLGGPQMGMNFGAQGLPPPAPQPVYPGPAALPQQGYPLESNQVEYAAESQHQGHQYQGNHCFKCNFYLEFINLHTSFSCIYQETILGLFQCPRCPRLFTSM